MICLTGVSGRLRNAVPPSRGSCKCLIVGSSPDRRVGPNNVASRTVRAFRVAFGKLLVVRQLLAGRQGFEPR